MRSSKLTAAATTAALIATLHACDGTTDPGNGAPHGLRISLNGATLVRIDGSQVDGSLHTHVGEYSGRFIIQPVDAGGRIVAAEGAYTLQATVADPIVATFVPVAGGAFEGEIISHREGATTITFRVVAAGDDAAAYQAPPIPLAAVACGAISRASCW
jgi:hypothetical protein